MGGSHSLEGAERAEKQQQGQRRHQVAIIGIIFSWIGLSEVTPSVVQNVPVIVISVSVVLAGTHPSSKHLTEVPCSLIPHHVASGRAGGRVQGLRL